MSNDSQNSWSSDPWAPSLTPRQYSAERLNLLGNFIGAIFYGIGIILFFRCMSGLLFPVGRTRIKWWLVAHVVAMFSIVTVFNVASLSFLPICYIDGREFPGDGDLTPPGPFGCLYSANGAFAIVPLVTALLNQWLADGLLLYRCYIIYDSNRWVVAFPCLMFLAAVAMGITYLYQSIAMPDNQLGRIDFGVPSYSISFSLSVFLTFMIVARLVLHSRRIRDATNSLSRASGSYKATITILVESYALFTLSHLLFLASLAAGNRLENIFFPIFVGTQVVAPFLIVLRVTNRSAVTGEGTGTPYATSTLRFGGSKWKPTGGNSETSSDGYPLTSMGADAEAVGEIDVGAENTVDEVPS